MIAAPQTNEPVGVESVRDQGERDEQAEPDVREHAVHHGRGRRQDPARRGRGDRLGATLLLLRARVAHREERAHQAAHEGQPGEEQEERERAVVDAVRRAAEDEDRAGRDRDAEDLASVLLLAVGVVHRRDRGVRQQRGADDPQRELQPVAADALPQQHERAWSRPRLRFDRGELVAVVAQEEVLERGRRDGQALHLEAGELGQHAGHAVAVDREPHPAAVDDEVVRVGDRRDRRLLRRVVRERDLGAGEVTEFGERAALDGLARRG